MKPNYKLTESAEDELDENSSVLFNIYSKLYEMPGKLYCKGFDWDCFLQKLHKRHSNILSTQYEPEHIWALKKGNSPVDLKSISSSDVKFLDPQGITAAIMMLMKKMGKSHLQEYSGIIYDELDNNDIRYKKYLLGLFLFCLGLKSKSLIDKKKIKKNSFLEKSIFIKYYNFDNENKRINLTNIMSKKTDLDDIFGQKKVANKNINKKKSDSDNLESFFANCKLFYRVVVLINSYKQASKVENEMETNINPDLIKNKTDLESCFETLEENVLPKLILMKKLSEDIQESDHLVNTIVNDETINPQIKQIAGKLQNITSTTKKTLSHDFSSIFDFTRRFKDFLKESKQGIFYIKRPKNIGKMIENGKRLMIKAQETRLASLKTKKSITYEKHIDNKIKIESPNYQTENRYPEPIIVESDGEDIKEDKSLLLDPLESDIQNNNTGVVCNINNNDFTITQECKEELSSLIKLNNLGKEEEHHNLSILNQVNRVDVKNMDSINVLDNLGSLLDSESIARGRNFEKAIQEKNLIANLKNKNKKSGTNKKSSTSSRFRKEKFY